MSGFLDFQNAVMADEALQDRLDDLIANPDFNDDSLIAFAGELGFTVTQEELHSTVQTLSDEALGGVAGGAGGDSGASMLKATKELQEMNQQFNMEYLNLQQEMQGENRRISALSNVMKTKHDTAKAMIQDVR